MFLPVLLWELRHTFRQRWFANVRRVYALIVLALFLWYSFEMLVFVDWSLPSLGFHRFLWVAREHDGRIPAMQVLAVLLFTPIFAVLEVVQTRNRRMFDLLLTSQQRPLDIVVSFWLSAIAKVVIVTLPGLPLVFWMHSFRGTPWWMVLVWLLCILLLSAPLSAWSLFAALYLRRSATAIFVACLGSVAVCPAIYYVFTQAELRYWLGGRFDLVSWERFALFLGIPTLAFLLISAFRLRAWIEGTRQSTARSVRAGGYPPVGDDPYFWKQYHFHDFSHIGWLGGLPSWLRLIVFVIVSCAACSLPARMADLTPYFEACVILIVFPVGALIVAGSTASMERESSTWDALRVTMLGADEYVQQTLHAVLLRMRPYWIATLPAVLVLSCKRGEIGWLVPFVWLIAGSLMRPAAILGLCYSVKSASAVNSVLQSLMWFLAFVIGAGLLMLACLFVSLLLLHTCFELRPSFFVVGRRNIVLTTLLHLMLTWLLLQIWFRWYTGRQFGNALAYLAEHERLEAIAK